MIDSPQQPVSSMLHEETQFFRDNLEKFLNLYPGQIALIKKSELVGVFGSEEEALNEGTKLFGFQPFLIRRIERNGHELFIPALALGILGAHTPQKV